MAQTREYPETMSARIAEIEEFRAALLSELTEDSAQPSAPAGRWAANEIAYHLHLTEQLLTQMLQAALESGQRERFPDDRLRKEWQGIDIATDNREQRFSAPEMLKPNNAPPLAECKRLLGESRAALLALLNKYTLEDFASIGAPHPVKEIGIISGAGWISLVGLHEKRHTEQLRELKK